MIAREKLKVKCPNCNENIEITTKFTECMNDEHWGYYDRFDSGTCKKCKIKYINGKWEIPKELQPTEKQCKTVKFIENRLDVKLHDDIGLKKRYWKFISQYFEEAKKVKLEPYYDEDYYDWYDESDFY